MAKPRLLFLGGAGLLSVSLQRVLAGLDRYELVSLTRAEVDVAEEEFLESVIDTYRPDWVINGVGFLGPDRCEADPKQSRAINFLAVARLCNVLKRLKGPRLVHFSTDYVFDGREGGYGEENASRPLSTYGMHKLLADEAVLQSGLPAYIFRVASVIGAAPGKPDIIKALLGRVAQGATPIRVVQDMEISTSSTRFIAHVLDYFLTRHPAAGLYHTVAEGKTTWFDIVRVAFDELGVRVPLVPISASEFPRPAPRPMKSWLKTDKLKAVLGRVQPWEEMVRAQVSAERAMYLSVLEKDKAA